MRRCRNSIGLVAAALAMATGCGGGESSLAPAQASGAGSQPGAAVVRRDAPAEASSSSANGLQQPDYKPPFPGRSNPFVAVVTRRPETSPTKPQSNQSVQLMGIGTVDEPTAILAFDGVQRLVAVGESVNDVQVLAIDHPNVKLQRLSTGSVWVERLQ